MKLDFFCRVHTVNPAEPTEDEKETKVDRPRLPPSVVVLDTETVENIALDFEFGCYSYCELEDGSYVSREDGILFHDDLPLKFERAIRRYAECPPAHLGELPQVQIRVRTRADFVKNVLWPTLRTGGSMVGLNLGFDLSRISVHHASKRDGKTFKFFICDYLDKKTGKRKPSSVVPAITRKSIDSKKSFYGLQFSFPCKPDGTPVVSDEEIAEFRRSRFIDVRTVAASLTNESHSLASLCRAFNAPPDIAKLKYVPGPITSEKIRYCRQDVKATLWALNTLAAEFLRHPIDLAIDRAYSPVSLAKSYLDKMNIIPPQEKFNIPSEIQAAAMEAFYAGRTETRIRK
jgi:hypothetical protein